MPLLTGDWSLVAEGFEGTLVIQSVSASGVLGFLISARPLGLGNPVSEFRTGFWDESSQAMTLQVVTFTLREDGQFAGHNAQFSFEGCLFRTPAQAGPAEDVLWTLQGLFSMTGAASGFAPTSRRHRFGWNATLKQTL
jgi:hypothetical protein